MGSNRPLNYPKRIYRPVNLFLKCALQLLSNISYINDIVMHYIWHFGVFVSRETNNILDKFRAPLSLRVSRETISHCE